MTTITCANCRKTCEKPTKEISRQQKQGRNNFYCSRSCSQFCNHIRCEKIISKCLWCKKDFQTTTRKQSRKCCSYECSHKYAQSFSDKNKISLSMKVAWERGDFDNIHGRVTTPRVYNFVCVVCNQPFQRITKKLISQVKTCSNKCYRLLLKRKATENPNCGGETGYRHYKYNGIWMDSKWEIELAKWMDTEGIEWDRNRKHYMFWWTDDSGNKRRYYPDFYLPKFNVYLDPKNKYKMEKDRLKMDRVVKENGIILFWGLLENVKKEVDILRKV